MIFHETVIPDVFVIDLELHEDQRGWFARTYSQREFMDHGIVFEVKQSALSHNRVRGTLRGIHLQRPPHAEKKLIRCLRGRIWDVAVDLRKASPTFKRWHAVELSQDNRKALLVPENVGHGFITLQDDSEVYYEISALHEPTASIGVRWNDPVFAIQWPEEPTVISLRDKNLPDFHDGLLIAQEGAG